MDEENQTSPQAGTNNELAVKEEEGTQLNPEASDSTFSMAKHHSLLEKRKQRQAPISILKKSSSEFLHI